MSLTMMTYTVTVTYTRCPISQPRFPLGVFARKHEPPPFEDGAIPDNDPARPDNDDAEARARPLHRYRPPLGDDTRSLWLGRSVADRVWISWAGEPTGESFSFLFFSRSAAGCCTEEADCCVAAKHDRL